MEGAHFLQQQLPELVSSKPTALTIRTRPSTLRVSLSHQEAYTSLLFLFIRGQTEWKAQSQKTNQTDHMDHSFV